MHTGVNIGLAVALIVLVTIVALWDTYAIFARCQGDTVSAILYGWARDFPPLVLGIGIVIGHLFWPS